MQFPMNITIQKVSHSYLYKSWGPCSMVLRNEKDAEEIKKTYNLGEEELVGDHKFYGDVDYDGYDERELLYVLKIKVA